MKIESDCRAEQNNALNVRSGRFADPLHELVDFRLLLFTWDHGGLPCYQLLLAPPPPELPPPKPPNPPPPKPPPRPPKIWENKSQKNRLRNGVTRMINTTTTNRTTSPIDIPPRGALSG